LSQDANIDTCYLYTKKKSEKEKRKKSEKSLKLLKPFSKLFRLLGISGDKDAETYSCFKA